MLVIRNQQMSVFEKAATENRFNRFYDNLARIYPHVAARLGAEGVRARAQRAMDRAESHGFRERENIEAFVHIAFLLDREDFDTAPETQWAGQILAWENADAYTKIAALEKRIQDDAMKAAVEAEK